MWSCLKRLGVNYHLFPFLSICLFITYYLKLPKESVKIDCYSEKIICDFVFIISFVQNKYTCFAISYIFIEIGCLVKTARKIKRLFFCIICLFPTYLNPTFRILKNYGNNKLYKRRALKFTKRPSKINTNLRLFASKTYKQVCKYFSKTFSNTSP